MEILLCIVWYLCFGQCFTFIDATDTLVDFDYCCLDCIQKSNYHVACPQRITITPGCRTYQQILGGDSKDDERNETTTALPTRRSTGTVSTTNFNISTTTRNETSAANVSTTETSNSSSTSSRGSTSTTVVDQWRFKRQLNTWNRVLADLKSRRVEDDDLRDAINAARRDWATVLTISNMEEMLYDEELGDIAEVVAGTCNSRHNFCADTPGFEVNILTFNGTMHNDTNFTATDVLMSWSRGRSELLNRGRADNVYRRPNRNTDSFSLIIWATTSRMGCADAVFKNPRSDNADMSYQITCLFGPAGNKVGEPMWMKGAACTACPQETSCRSGDNLCTRASARTFQLDQNRTSRCIKRRDDSPAYQYERQMQEAGRFRDFETGITVVLQPRKICDPISDKGTSILEDHKVWKTAAGILLPISFKWITLRPRD